MSTPRKILFVCQVFYPDTTSTSQLFTSMFAEMVKEGHDITALCAFPSGKEGRGRFRTFALGRVVDWHSRYGTPQGLRQFTMTACKDRPKRVEVGQDGAAQGDAHRGVTVTVSELHRNFKSLRPAERPCFGSIGHLEEPAAVCG